MVKNRVTIITASAGKDEEQLDLSYIVGMYNGTTTLENNF